MANADRRELVEDDPAFTWEPYRPSGVLRVTHTSCCGMYEFASRGGTFFVLRHVGGARYEETGRGRYPIALAAYIALVKQHHADHRGRGERPEPDTYLAREGRRG